MASDLNACRSLWIMADCGPDGRQRVIRRHPEGLSYPASYGKKFSALAGALLPCTDGHCDLALVYHTVRLLERLRVTMVTFCGIF